MDKTIADVTIKIQKEKMILDGAMKMLAAQPSPSAKSMVEMNIIEARRRLEFLEGELRKLDLKRNSVLVSKTETATTDASQTSLHDEEEEDLESNFG
jgi:hypothetical protein